MGNPELLLLDEPSAGPAPIIVQRIGELLRQLRGTSDRAFDTNALVR